MIKEMKIEHVAAIAAKRMARQDRKEVVFPIRPPYVPPGKGEYDTPYGKMKVVAWLDQEKGQWKVRVKLLDTEFNTALTRETGEALLKKMNSK